MENFKPIACELNENGQLVNAPAAMARGLVLVNHKTGAAYAVEVKCRQSTPEAMAKALAKAMLAVACKANEKNSKADAKAAKKRVVSPFSSALSGDSVYLLDGNKNVIPGAVLSVQGETKMNGNPLKLSDTFRFSQTQPLYKLVVIEGKEWNTPEVQTALTQWCNAAIDQMHWLKEADEAIGKAAADTEAEDAPAEKPAYTEAEAVKKPAKQPKKQAA